MTNHDRVDATGAEEFAGVFTTEELFALSYGFDLPLPWFLRGASVVESWPDNVAKDVAAIGGRSLAARGLVVEEGTGWATASPVRLMSEVISEPLLVVGVARAANGQMVDTSFVSRPGGTVAHSSSTPGLHRVVLFPTHHMLARVVATAGLRFVKLESDETGFALEPDQVASIVQGANAATDLDEERLTAAGLAPDVARLFLRLQTEGRSASVVHALHPTSSASVEGSVTVWVDAGDDGLWLVEPAENEPSTADQEPTRVRFIPTGSQGILDSIRSGLPRSPETNTHQSID